MWPFSKKESKTVNTEKQEKRNSEQVALQKIVFSEYPLGAEFVYLGVKFKVKKLCVYTQRVVIDEDWGIRIPEQLPAIVCNYADSNNSIHEIVFSCKEITHW
jgi:hypothetical protein